MPNELTAPAFTVICGSESHLRWSSRVSAAFRTAASAPKSSAMVSSSARVLAFRGIAVRSRRCVPGGWRGGARRVASRPPSVPGLFAHVHGPLVIGEEGLEPEPLDDSLGLFILLAAIVERHEGIQAPGTHGLLSVEIPGMVLALEKKGLIFHVPPLARSIPLWLKQVQMPALEDDLARVFD